MFFRKNKIEVVQPREYSHTDTLAYLGGRSVCEKRKTTVGNNIIAPLATIPLFIAKSVSAAPVNGEWAVQTAPSVAVPTGLVADKSLEMLATVLDPVIQILVAFSFPVASVIVVASFFLIMIGNQERAFDMVMKAGSGYVLIQLSPILLEILRTVGEAI